MAIQSLVPVGVEERQAKEPVLRQGLVARGAHTSQVVTVGPLVQQAHHLATELLVFLVLMGAEMGVVEVAVIQVPALEGLERLEARLEAEAVAEGHLILELAARPAQAQMARHESIVGR